MANWRVIVLLVCVAVVAACGDDSADADASPPAPDAPSYDARPRPPNQFALTIPFEDNLLVTSDDRFGELDEMTIEGWVRRTTGGLILNSNKYRLQISGNGALRMFINDNTTTCDVSGGAVDIGEWVHVAGTFRAGDRVAVYINGVEEASADCAVEAMGTITAVAIGTNLAATVDEIRLWNVVRSADELAANATRELAGDIDGVVAIYGFPEGSGDTTGSRNHADNPAELRNHDPITDRPEWSDETPF